MKHNVLIDGTMILYGVMSVNKEDYNIDSEYIGGVTGTLKQIGGIINYLSPDKVFVTFDVDRSAHRLKLYPHYKAGRHTKIADDLRARYEYKLIHTSLLKILLPTLGCYVLTHPETEADDVIANFVGQSKHYTTIVSTDRDFIQLIDSKTRLYRPVTSQMIDVDNVDEFLGYSHAYNVAVKIICGDKSDNIPGIMGIGEKTAIKIFNAAGGCTPELVLEYAKNELAVPKSKFRFAKDVVSFIESSGWELNRRLMDLKDGPKFKIEMPTIEPNHNEAIQLLNDIGIGHIWDEETTYYSLAPYQNLY